MKPFDRRFMGMLVAALAMAAPASAFAHDTYVDHTDGSGGTNDCKHKSDPCSLLTKGIENAGHGDTVFIGGDPLLYETPHTLDDGKSMVRKDFSKTLDTSGKAVIDTGSDSAPAIEVTGKAGQIKGLLIRSDTLPLRIQAGVKVVDDKFVEDAALDESILITSATTGKVTIKDSTLRDQTPLTGSGDEQDGISDASSGSVKILHNDFEDLYQSIVVSGPQGTVKIDNNDLTGTHTRPPATSPRRSTPTWPSERRSPTTTSVNRISPSLG